VTDRYPVPSEVRAPAELAVLLARAAGSEGGMTLVYAPSTTTVTAPVGGPALAWPLPPSQPPTVLRGGAAYRRSYSLGELVAYCGATALGSGAGLAIGWLTWCSPLPAGALAVLGALGSLGGVWMDHAERGRSGR
jgi:hypothetical protein